jgi:hypothetical protein
MKTLEQIINKLPPAQRAKVKRRGSELIRQERRQQPNAETLAALEEL